MKEEGFGRVAVETQIPFTSQVFRTEMFGLVKVHQEVIKILL
jgi:hypothetical protein